VGKVYSHRFVAANNIPPVADFTCPAGYVAVLRWVNVYKASEPSGGLLNISIKAVVVMMQINVQANDGLSQAYEFRQVFNAGETLEFFAGVGNWSVTASGYLLSLP